jgi:1,4-dihydroxy-2-naphthoyl-CoA hydrolase
VYCAAVETAASIAAEAWRTDSQASGTGKSTSGPVVGVANQTDFLRSVSAGRLTATASPVHRGRSQQLWLVEITDAQDRLIARGQVRIAHLDAPVGNRSPIRHE